MTRFDLLFGPTLDIENPSEFTHLQGLDVASRYLSLQSWYTDKVDSMSPGYLKSDLLLSSAWHLFLMRWAVWYDDLELLRLALEQYTHMFTYNLSYISNVITAAERGKYAIVDFFSTLMTDDSWNMVVECAMEKTPLTTITYLLEHPRTKTRPSDLYDYMRHAWYNNRLPVIDYLFNHGFAIWYRDYELLEYINSLNSFLSDDSLSKQTKTLQYLFSRYLSCPLTQKTLYLFRRMDSYQYIRPFLVEWMTAQRRQRQYGRRWYYHWVQWSSAPTDPPRCLYRKWCDETTRLYQDVGWSLS